MVSRQRFGTICPIGMKGYGIAIFVTVSVLRDRLERQLDSQVKDAITLYKITGTIMPWRSDRRWRLIRLRADLRQTAVRGNPG